MRISDVAASAGIGLAAGAAGTAAMTISSTIEAKVRDRGASTAPADAAGVVLGVEPRDEQGRQRFAQLVHWAYGTGWGMARGVLGELIPSEPLATAAHGALLWTAEQIALPLLGVMPPLPRQGAKEIAIDLAHHAVYTCTTGAAYTYLTHR